MGNIQCKNICKKPSTSKYAELTTVEHNTINTTGTIGGLLKGRKYIRMYCKDCRKKLKKDDRGEICFSCDSWLYRMRHEEWKKKYGHLWTSK